MWRVWLHIAIHVSIACTARPRQEAVGRVPTVPNTPPFGGLTGAGSFALPANVTALTLNPPGGFTRTYTGDLSGGTNLALNKSNSGTQVLSGTNSYSGVTTINAGAARVTNTPATETSS